MRAFYVLWGGQFVSIFASQMTAFVITLWAWDLTGSATALVLVGLASFLPRMLLSPFAGTLVDRWNRKLMMAVADGGAALATAFLFLMFVSGKAEIWHLYLSGVFVGSFGAFQYPATTAAITTMVSKDQYSRANSLLSLISSASGIGAPLLAGGLIGILSISSILIIDLVTFLIAVATLLLIHIPQPIPTEEGKTGDGSFWLETLQGVKYILARQSLVAIFLLFMISNIAGGFITPMVNPLLLARTGNNAAILGLVRSAGSFGYLVGGLLMSAWKGPKKRVYGIATAFILEGSLGAVLLGIGRTTTAWMIGVFITGLSITILNTLYLAILQTKIAPDLQGRVFGIEYFTTAASYPAGQLLAGLLADNVFEPAMQTSSRLASEYGWLVGTGPGSGLGLILVIGGLLCIVVGQWCYLIRPIREIESLLPDHSSDPV